MTLRMLRRPAIEELTGLSRSTLYAMMADGTFPKSVKLGKRAVGWPENIIHEWLAQRCNTGADLNAWADAQRIEPCAK